MAQHFEDISIDDILSVAEREHEAHSRFVQVLCINGEEGINLVYSYQKTADQGYAMHNYRVHGVKPETHIPSVTKFYLVAFPFENEAHDLFGVQVDDIAIDFKGGFYKVAMDKPMTVISPAQKAAREKAAKLAAAKAAQEAASKTEAAAGEGAQAAPAIDWGAERAKVEAKCANLDADKAAKVMAAFEAKMKKAQAEAAKAADVKPAVDWGAERTKVEAKCANLPEDKAAKVMAAFEAKVRAAQGDASAKGGE
ncbi:NADH-quinone oxidoreductase subunit C [Slackia isoflavoniconvertens]|uniref:NADH-quinone oxidoreductase subunit C n=1 Tax=Slackia isoflavoniconvertens TaxID=572010 RepID=UPI00248D485B|nr:NADH-quinone oxidoreductase subunit C [Slackia isoflavoniconvertens]